MALHFAFEVFHCLRYTGISIERRQWKANVEARQLDLIARALGLVDRPSLLCAAVDFD